MARTSPLSLMPYFSSVYVPSTLSAETGRVSSIARHSSMDNMRAAFLFFTEYTFFHFVAWMNAPKAGFRQAHFSD